MKNVYEIDDTLSDLAAEVIKQREDLTPIAISGMRIGFVTSTEYKRGNGKIVFADTRVVKGVWQAFVPYDFIITFYLRNTVLLTDEQLAILMWHELKHCGISPTGNYYVVPHDIEDFRDILEECGIEWADCI